MSKSKNSKLDVVMFPWFSYGHIIPFLHLSNKIAERGHSISFILPKSTLLKVGQLNQYPTLIQFFPLEIPKVDGLPPGAETTSDLPFQLQKHLFAAFDKSQDQVQSYLATLKPDLVLYDFAVWIPALGREKLFGYHGFKSICFKVVNSVIQAFYSVPSRRIVKDMPGVEELMQPPPGFPSSSVHIKRHEAAQRMDFYHQEHGSEVMPFQERLFLGMTESDAIAFRACSEIEGSFCDYIAQQYKKPVLLTGLILPETSATQLEEKWASWLNKFEVGSVVCCTIGSQITLQKDQFQELVLGFEATGLPFLVALTPPHGCATIEEALPDGFEVRVEGRGWVYGGWVPQPLILKHPSIGCFVSHCGPGTLWESLLSECQLVLIPHLIDQVMHTRLMVLQLKVAVEVERGENLWIAKESLIKAIKLVMDKNCAVAADLRSNHAGLRSILSSKELQESYIDNFISSMQDLVENA